MAVAQLSSTLVAFVVAAICWPAASKRVADVTNSGVLDSAASSSAKGSLDWSSLVTPAGFQGGVCNSCYVWAAVGSIEARAAIAAGKDKAEALSVQQVLDCTRMEHMRDIGITGVLYRSSRGCETGFPAPVMQYAIDEGLMLAGDYPVAYDPSNDGSYRRDKEKQFQCEVDTSKIAVKVVGGARQSIQVARGGGSAAWADWGNKVMAALEKGPVAVGIDKTSYQVGSQASVRAGKVATKDCPTQNNDHAVLIVGFGDEDGVPYWNIRNSWGEAWGSKGFFKVPRGVNFCGVETAASYVEFPKSP